MLIHVEDSSTLSKKTACGLRIRICFRYDNYNQSNRARNLKTISSKKHIISLYLIFLLIKAKETSNDCISTSLFVCGLNNPFCVWLKQPFLCVA